MASEIIAMTKELDSIEAEIVRLNAIIIKHKKRRETIKQNFKIYIENHQPRGFKCRDKSFVLAPKERRERKNKAQKIESCTEILRTYGITNSSASKEILEAIRGNKVDDTKLIIN